MDSKLEQKPLIGPNATKYAQRRHLESLLEHCRIVLEQQPGNERIMLEKVRDSLRTFILLFHQPEG